MQVSVTTTADALGKRLSNAVARQLPFATAVALTDLAKQVREAERVEMARVFDRPTRFALDSFMVVPARKDSLVAEVRPKPLSQAHGHFLERNAGGGFRVHKSRTETRLDEVMDHLSYGFVPADNAKLDAYGNWDAGERNRVLSALQAQGDPFANTTSASRKRGRRTATYFIPKARDDGGLPPGVYRRQGKQLGIVLAFLKQAPRYEPIFDFYGVARRTWDATWEATFAAAMQRALDTAR